MEENPEESTARVANPQVEAPTRTKEKSERSWWRKSAPDQAPLVSSPQQSPSTPTSPTSPTTFEHTRFEFVLPSRTKLLTLNDVFPPTLTSDTNNSDDYYRDTITVSWDQTIESKRVSPKYPPHIQKENVPQNHTSNVEMKFMGAKQREVPTQPSIDPHNRDVCNFIPRKDAQEFKPQVQGDYYYKTEKHLSMLEKKENLHQRREVKQPQYDYYSSRPKPSVKPDTHNLPYNDSTHYRDSHRDYPERGRPEKYRDYPVSSSSSARTISSRERHHPSDALHGASHYAPSGYPESRSLRDEYRGDPGREHYERSRRYDREAAAQRYYEKELRAYRRARAERDRLMYDMSTEDMVSRYERRRQPEQNDYTYRERYHRSSDRISTYDEYERVVAERQRRALQERPRRPPDLSYSNADQQDPRWREYYRMKYDEARRQRQHAY